MEFFVFILKSIQTLHFAIRKVITVIAHIFRILEVKDRGSALKLVFAKLPMDFALAMNQKSYSTALQTRDKGALVAVTIQFKFDLHANEAEAVYWSIAGESMAQKMRYMKSSTHIITELTERAYEKMGVTTDAQALAKVKLVLPPKLIGEVLAFEYSKVIRTRPKALIAVESLRAEFPKLDIREAEVIYLISENHSNLTIGTELEVSSRTVGRWCISLYEKIRVADRDQALVKALRILGK